MLTKTMRRALPALGLLCLLASTRAYAQREVITDVRVENAVRTNVETILSISGLTIGEVLETDTLDMARQRLNSSGMFASVDVYFEPYQEGVRVAILVSEKFPWAPLPTFSYSPGNVSAGGLLVHGNLFGRGKRGVIGGRVSNVDSGALIAYEDPAVLGSWGFFTLKGRYQSQTIPEYSNTNLPAMPLLPMRNTRLRSYGFDASVGVAWFRRVRTSFGWIIDRNDVTASEVELQNPLAVQALAPQGGPPPAATQGARRGSITVNLTFDFRAREQAIMYGNALGFGLEYAARRWGSEESARYWKASVSYEHGIRFFRRHNLVARVGGITGVNLPLWSENSAGGTNLRGYLYRQFQGDTHIYSQVEYHFPIFGLFGLDVRGLVFCDAAAIWFRRLPEVVVVPGDPNRTEYARRNDGRQFLPPEYLRPGFKANEDIHSSAGAGLRFHLRTVAMPLVGFDVGNGIGTKDVRIILVLGV
jgi:outer membrane protein assembly factor BamA